MMPLETYWKIVRQSFLESGPVATVLWLLMGVSAVHLGWRLFWDIRRRRPPEAWVILTLAPMVLGGCLTAIVSFVGDAWVVSANRSIESLVEQGVATFLPLFVGSAATMLLLTMVAYQTLTAYKGRRVRSSPA